MKKKIQNTNPDILIIGAGLTGSILSHALQKAGYHVILCDAGDLNNKTTPSFDARSIALNEASIRILKALDLWQDMATHATAIQSIEVSSQGEFGATQLKGTTEAPLGMVVEMHRFYEALIPNLDIEHALFHTQLKNFDVTSQEVTLIKQGKELTLKPKLIVAADGTQSSFRDLLSLKVNTHGFEHHALVANIALRRPHKGRAFERFTRKGPVALLPLENDRVSLVWCLPENEAKALQQASETQFMTALYEAFGYRLGWFKEVGKRVCIPLEQTMMPQPHQWPVVFIGNAAQTLHPIAAQGLNLGLRDIAHLIQCIINYGLEPNMLSIYHSLRDKDRQMMVTATQTLLSIFNQDKFLMPGVRGLGLCAFDASTLAQSNLIRYASGLGGTPPDLACGFSLTSLLKGQSYEA